MKIDISSLVKWSAPKRVHTKNGPRNLLTSLESVQGNNTFWSIWHAHKSELKAAGLSFSKKPNGDFELVWWQPLSEEETKTINSTIEASKATDADIEIPIPNGLEFLPFQKAGIAYALSREGTLIADDMGLGKTCQGIGLINVMKPKNALVICPASLKLNWLNEFKKFLTADLTVGIASSKEWPQTDIVIINYDILVKYPTVLRKHEWDILIVDEAHFIKNNKASRTEQVLGSYHRDGSGIEAIPAKKKVFLTGTPILNRPSELWTLVKALDPQGLGRSWKSFVTRYCGAYQDRYGWHTDGADNLDELQTRLRSSFMVRRLKTDVLKELPPKRRQVIEIPVDAAEEVKKIREVADMLKIERDAVTSYEQDIAALKLESSLAEVAGDEEAYKVAVAKLRDKVNAAFQEISKLRHDTALIKVPFVVEHLRTLVEAGHPVVCFAHHLDVVDAIKAEFPEAVVFTSEVSLENRNKAVESFQAGQTKIFLGTIKAAGVGITLTKSSNVIFAEEDFTPGWMTQAEDRCCRIGQQDSVLVQHIVLENSLDAHLAKMLLKKQAIIDAALDKDVTFESEPLLPLTFEVDESVLRPTPGEKQVALPPETVNEIHSCLKDLSSVCDGARVIDGAGFNKFDTAFGKGLAAASSLNNKQARAGLRLIKKYRKQFPEDRIQRLLSIE